MKKQKIKDRLDTMKGKAFTYRGGQELKIINYSMINGQVKLDTDNGSIKFNIDRASEELDHFTPAGDQHDITVYNTEELTESTFKKDSRRMGNMEDVLMENIHGLQKGEVDVENAKEVNSAVKIMLDISKQRLKMLQEVRRAKKMGDSI